ncbi:MAG: pectin acetylesterase-family hydrolase [Anaerolineae bacterium]
MRTSYIALILLILFSPLVALAYGLLLLFGRTHRYRGEFRRPRTWYSLTLPREAARCSEDSPYSIYLKKGTTNKLIVFFSGGGLAWDAYSAARPQTLATILFGSEGFYFPNVKIYLEFINGGLLAPNNPRNPFNDWNCVLIPYATADCHVGRAEFPYRDRHGRERLLHHHGVKNADAALAVAQAVFGNPEEILVAGESAGGLGCVAQAPHVAEYFCCTKVTVYSDSGQMYSPKWPAIVRDVWSAGDDLADCVTDGNLLLSWFRYCHARLGDGVTYLMSCSSHDGTLTAYENMLNHQRFTYDQDSLTEFHQHLTETITALAREIPRFRFLVSEQGKNKADGSTLHTAARYPWYYSRTAEGPSLASWLNDAVQAGNLYNVGTHLLVQPEPESETAAAR